MTIAHMSLDDGAVLITGAGSGIGMAMAQSIAAAGAKVAVNDIDAEAAEGTCKLIIDAGGVAVATPGDVAGSEGAREVVEAAVVGLGKLTGLVNNVGLVRGGRLLDITEAEWDFVMRVDCSSALFCSQAAYPHLTATGGPIVNTSSLCAVFPAPGAGSYNAAKAALVTLTQQLALEWGPEGIRVNAIAPGMISGTHFSASSQDEGAAQRRGLIVPLRRTGRAGDIAPVAVFLLSDAARYMTGQLITVDGGLGISLQTFIPA
jgi:NAD(P)-dependent dehydrogenase (short-subunit alcohol dehydrogenase family)